MTFHGLDTRDAREDERSSAHGRNDREWRLRLEEDEVVEDAGLFDHDEALAVKGTQLVRTQI